MPLKLRQDKATGIWHVWGTVAGIRIRESTKTADRRLAEEWRSTRETAEYRADLHGAPRGSVAFSVAVLSYLDAAPRRPADQGYLRKLLAFLGPKAQCRDVNQARLDLAAAAILRPGVSPSTKLRQIITPARAVLLHAARRGWCDQPAFEAIRQPPGRTQWLAPAQAEALVSAAAPHLHPLLVFLISTGARMSEALELEWPEVDLRHRRATLVETKNGRDRIVILLPRAFRALAELPHREGRVFRPPRGEAYHDTGRAGGGQVKRAWATACWRAGLPGRIPSGSDPGTDRKSARPPGWTPELSPHALRHTWASWHYAMHRDLLRLREDGCWSSVELVQRYAHLVPDGMVPEIRAWLRLDEALSAVMGTDR